jgi:hypothetical protein
MAFVPDEAVSRSDELTGSGFKAYAYLCKRRDHKTGICWPSSRQMAADLKIGQRRAVSARQELIEKRWISFEEEKHGQTPIIRLLVGFVSDDKTTTLGDDRLSPPEMTERHQEVMTKSAKGDDKTDSKVMTKPTQGDDKLIRRINRLNQPMNQPMNQPTHTDARAREPADAGVCVPGSSYSLEECRKYAESLPDIRNPAGFAKSIQRSGADDAAVAQFLKDGAKTFKQLEEERNARIFRRIQERRASQGN